MHTAGAAERVHATSEIGIRVKVRSHRAEGAPHPASHAQFGRVFQVTEKAIEPSVTFRRPF
eukprot:9883601-Alexandrium_andersonii.AAC.1